MEETLPYRSISACCSTTGHFHVTPLQPPHGPTPCHQASSQNQGLSVVRYPPIAAGGGGFTVGLRGMVPTTNQSGSNKEHNILSTMSLSHHIRCSVNLCECIVERGKATGSGQPAPSSPLHTGQTSERFSQATEETALVFHGSTANMH